MQKVKPYEHEKGSKKNQVGKMFDNIAPNYDLLNRILSLGIDQRWRHRLIQVFSKGEAFLDVATGTGDVAIALAQKLPNALVTGFDLSQKMLDVGKSKSSKRNLSRRIDFIQGDAENMPFQTNTFDGICASFGVRNFGNLEMGLSEMYRVLDVEGTLAILEFSRPTRGFFKYAFNFYFKYFLPVLGRIKSGDPFAYEYLYRSVQEFPDGDDFKAILKKVNFRNIEAKRLTSGICTLYTAKK